MGIPSSTILRYNEKNMGEKMIDIHTHGLGRYDTRSGKSEHILRMAEDHGSQGVTAIIPTVYPDNIQKMRSDMKAIAEAMDARPLKGQARILGAHLEGPFLNPLMAGALDSSTFLEPGTGSLKELLEGFEQVVKILTISPELKGAEKVIEQAAGMGIVVSMGHSSATYAEALRGKEAGAKSVTHLFNAMTPIHHRETGLAVLALTDEDLYVEVICDGIHVSLEALRLVLRAKPSERIIAISDSVKGPMKKAGILQGGGSTLNAARDVLECMGLSPLTLRLFLKNNAERLLWL